MYNQFQIPSFQKQPTLSDTEQKDTYDTNYISRQKSLPDNSYKNDENLKKLASIILAKDEEMEVLKCINNFLK